jgi:hypothetical protein
MKKEVEGEYYRMKYRGCDNDICSYYGAVRAAVVENGYGLDNKEPGVPVPLKVKSFPFSISSTSALMPFQPYF